MSSSSSESEEEESNSILRSRPQPVHPRRLLRRRNVSFREAQPELMDFDALLEWLENIEFQNAMGRAMEASMIDFDALRRPDRRIVPFPVIGSPRDDQCAICCFPVDSTQHTYEIPCGHLFHKECLDEWMGYRTVCPLCLETIRTITPPLIEEEKELEF